MEQRICTLLLVAFSLICVACGGGGSSTTSQSTYTIGGTVSGLSGTGLVLLDNTSDSLSISANGGFTFVIPISTGGAYNVTVSTQPSNPTQLCTITNGVGIANANITNVHVTCAAAYTIGGTVSGLSSAVQEALALQDNGESNVLINANGTFTFGTPVAVGGTYDVTVYLQPANRICTVSDGTGTANANVTNVQITCVSNELVLYSFLGTPDGGFPTANLVFDSSGNLYGTTAEGGAYNNGTVFKLTLNQGQWTETVIYSFCQQTPNCQDGTSPHSGLILDAQGNLYGTTLAGGAYGENGGSPPGYGVAFELTPSPNGTWTEKVLHSFGNTNDGIAPSSSLTFDKLGNLYGTTFSGGSSAGSAPCGVYGCGTVFELSPGSNGSWAESVLYNFCSQPACSDGENPQGTPVFDPSGNLYGTTVNGGTTTVFPYDNGKVFELTPQQNGQWNETVLYSFQDGPTDGESPLAGVILDKSGNLYGTTEFGGETGGGAAGNNGTVFEITPGPGGQWTETVLHIFCSDVVNCSDGSQPVAGLTLDGAGNLYGTTLGGGQPGLGNVFELSTGQNGKWILTPIYAFEGGAGGYGPQAGVILDKDGNLYGTAPYQGSSSGLGVVFEIIH